MTALEQVREPTAGDGARRPGGGRIAEFDVMRGVAIILVVYLHAWFSPWDVTPHRQQLALHVIHLFAHSAVPVFFFMSAFLLARDSSASFGEYARRRLQRLLVPLAVALAATVAYRLWQEGWTGDLRHDLLFFDVEGQYYYLAVLVFFMAAAWPARFLSERVLAWCLAAAFVANLAAIGWYERSTISGDFATLAYRNPAVWVFSFTAGLWAGRLDDALGLARKLLPAGLAAMAALIAVYLVRGERFDDYPVSYFGVSVFLFACCGLAVYPAAVGLLLRLGGVRIVLRPFEALSRYAYAIYLFHMPFFVGWVTDTYVANSRVRDDYWELMNTRFLAGFISAVVAIVTVDFVWPWGAEVLLGVEGRRRRRATPAAAGR